MNKKIVNIVDNFMSYGLPHTEAEQISKAINDKKIYLIAISGKLASGKDTIAVALLEALGVKDAKHLYYGDALKNEVDEIISILKNYKGEEAESYLKEIFSVDFKHAEEIYNILNNELLTNSEISARSRTPGIRLALQYWGTDVRRSQDENYWVNKTLKSVVEQARKGESVYLSDLRFPNEVEKANELGFITVRLEVTPDTQSSRLFNRDGIYPDSKSQNHFSETALDSYNDFVIKIDNNDTVAVGVEKIITELSF